MDATLVQLSTVVVGDNHNPSILNPDFLARQGIVAPEWGWESADNFTTPPLSLVRYKNGVTVTVEASKLQIVDSNVTDGPERTKVATIAAKYVAALPQVHYTAVGINFHSAVEVESPEDLLKERFLRPGMCDTREYPLQTAGFRFVYTLSDTARVILSMDAGQARKADEPEARPVILVVANFHRECTEHPATMQVAKHLENLSRDFAVYQELLCNSLLRNA